MGKIIRFKGADFSVNKVDVVINYNNNLELQNKGIQIVGESNLGDVNDNLNNLRLSSKTLVFVPKGKALYIKGLKGINQTSIALMFDYVYYSENTYNSSSYAGKSSTRDNDIFVMNREGEDTVKIENNLDKDYYYALVCSPLDKVTEIPSVNYSPLKYVVM
mgnify:CR=1 FL=1